MVIKRSNDKDLLPAILDTLDADSEGDDGANTSIISRVKNISQLQTTGRLKTQTGEPLEDLADEQQRSEHAGDNLRIWEAMVPKPAEADFNLSTYEKDAKYKANRDLDHEDRHSSFLHNKAGKYVGNAGRGAGIAAATVGIGLVGAVTIGERQHEFYQNMDNVSKVTGAPVKLMGAMWGIESSFSKNQTSPSGCQGPAQFTRGTFAAMIRQYGDHIPGMEQYAVGLRNGTISPKDANLQAMRNDQKVAGYAMGFYLQELAKDMKVDINDPNNWGKLYAAYNVGPANAKTLARNEGNNVNAAALIGSAATWNPAFFVNNATPAQAQKNYQTAISNGIQSFDTKIVAKIDPAAPQTISVASAVNGPAISSSAKPKAEFTDAKAKEQVDATVKTAEAEVGKFRQFTTKLYGFVALNNDAEPSPKLAAAAPEKPLVSLIYG